MFGVLPDDMLFGGAIGQRRDIRPELIDSLDHHGREFGLDVSDIPNLR
jgi:hypothetical protein